MNRLLIILCVCASVGWGADIIPDTRRVEWSPNTCGVDGGIQHRTTIYATFTSGATESSIQTALNNVNAQNKVVFLSNGNYTISSGLKVPSYVTLRGNGPTNTFLIGTYPEDNYKGIVYMGGRSGTKVVRSLSAVAHKGDNSVTIGTADATIQVDYIITIDQLDDNTSMIFGKSANGSDLRANNSARGGNVGDAVAGEYHHNSQNVKVTGISNGNKTFQFEPVLGFDFTNAPAIFYVTPQSDYTWFGGIEDLAVRNTHQSTTPNTGKYNNIGLASCVNCWVSNVWSIDAFSAHVETDFCYRPEIRHCTFSNNLFWTSSGGYGVLIQTTTGGRIEDNISVRTRDWIRINSGSMYNAILYNYHTNNVGQTNGTGFVLKCPPAGGSHDAFPMMNLWEGNTIYTPQFDDVWGGAGFGTLLRNWIRGPDPSPVVRKSGGFINTHFTSLFTPLYFFKWNLYYNIVGNVLGTPDIHSLANVSSWTSTRICNDSWNVGSQYTTFAVGYTADQGACPFSGANQWAGFIVAGNYDFVVNTQTWYNAASPSDTYSNSYFYTSKPSFFGILKWPPVDAISTNLYFGETNIPAGYRFVNGQDPPASTLTIAPQDLKIGVGQTVQFYATNDFGSGNLTNVTTSSAWTSSEPSCVSIDAATGLATALSEGKCRLQIFATWSNLTASAWLEVTNANVVTNYPIICDVRWWSPRCAYSMGPPLGPVRTNMVLTFETEPACTVMGTICDTLPFSNAMPTNFHYYSFSTNILYDLPCPIDAGNCSVPVFFTVTGTNGLASISRLDPCPLGDNIDISDLQMCCPKPCANTSEMTVTR